MATTWIHPIRTTVGKSLAYCVNDRVVNVVKADIPEDVFYYDEHPELPVGEVTLRVWTDYYNIGGDDLQEATREFERRINRFSKDYGPGIHGKSRIAYHLIQSFDESISVSLAHRIGCELAEKIAGEDGFQMVVSTHTDTDNIHNHIIFSAWDGSGKKYTDTHETYRMIRETSDRICEKYGVSILQHTKQQKLIHWKDSSGKDRYFEKTERKEKLREQRKAGTISNDDVSSYRNSAGYAHFRTEQTTVRDIVKHDIDELLPKAESYEHLLEMLRMKGYKIRDKKKDGSWMGHVSFLAPNAKKAVRDNSIDDGVFYTREKLTASIAAYEEMRAADKEEQEQLRQKYPDVRPLLSYDYGAFRASELNELISAYDDYGRIRYRLRGAPERQFIRDIKSKDAELHTLISDANTLDLRIRHQQDLRKSGNIPAYSELSYEDYLIQAIQDSVNMLHALEKMEAGDYGDIEKHLQIAQLRLDLITHDLKDNEQAIQRLTEALSYPQKADELVAKINRNIGNEEYMQTEYFADKRKLAQYQKGIHAARLDSPGGADRLKKKISRFTYQLSGLEDAVARAQDDLAFHKQIISALKAMDERQPTEQASRVTRPQEVPHHKKYRER